MMLWMYQIYVRELGPTDNTQRIGLVKSCSYDGQYTCVSLYQTKYTYPRQVLRSLAISSFVYVELCGQLGTRVNNVQMTI